MKILEVNQFSWFWKEHRFWCFCRAGSLFKRRMLKINEFVLNAWTIPVFRDRKYCAHPLKCDSAAWFASSRMMGSQAVVLLSHMSPSCTLPLGLHPCLVCLDSVPMSRWIFILGGDGHNLLSFTEAGWQPLKRSMFHVKWMWKVKVRNWGFP